MPSSCRAITEIYECKVCSALIPAYDSGDRKITLSDQVAFHESLWPSVDSKVLEKELHDLMGVIKFLNPYLGNPTNGVKVLEIGAGRGGMLRALLDSGYQAQGCEPAAALVSVGRHEYGLDDSVLCQTDLNGMLKTLNQGEKFSSIIMWHVLEHIINPLDALRKLISVLEPLGTIIIQIPLLKSNYIYEEHYYFFSHLTFKHVADTLGICISNIIYDEENMFATCIYTNGTGVSDIPFLDFDSVPDPISQLVLLTEKSRVSYKDFIHEYVKSSNEATATLHRIIQERENVIFSLETRCTEWLQLVDEMKKHSQDATK